MKVCGLAGIGPGAIDGVFHGTTVATNMAIELVGAEVGTITTCGFRDILHMARHRRPHNFSLQFDVPWQSKPLIKCRNRLPVTERIMTPTGEIAIPLAVDEARQAAELFAKRGMAVIVAFLVFLPQQRARVAGKEIVMSVLPNMSVSQRGPKTPRLSAQPGRASTRQWRQCDGPHDAVQRRHFDDREFERIADRTAAFRVRRRRHRRPLDGENWGKRNIITIRYLASGFMTYESDRNEYAPWGIFGGKSGHGSKLELRNTATREVSYQPAKFFGLRTNIGDTITYYSPVGGRFGASLDRDPRKVPDDVLDGFITVDHARDDCGVGVVLDDYGVVLSEVDDGCG